MTHLGLGNKDVISITSTFLYPSIPPSLSPTHTEPPGNAPAFTVMFTVNNAAKGMHALTKYYKQ